MLTGGTFQHLAQHTTTDPVTRLCGAKPGSLRVSASEVQRSGTATIIANIMVGAVIGSTACTAIVANVMVGTIICAMTYTVIIANVMVGAVICAMADTMRTAGVMIGTIIGTVTDTMGTAIIAATP